MARDMGWTRWARWVVAGALVLAPDLVAAADREFTAWQEITVFTVSKLEMAVANCVSAGLSLDEVHRHPRSAPLQQQIDAVASAYKADRAGSCAKAWDTFGPDGTTRGYLDQ